MNSAALHFTGFCWVDTSMLTLSSPEADPGLEAVLNGQGNAEETPAGGDDLEKQQEAKQAENIGMCDTRNSDCGYTVGYLGKPKPALDNQLMICEAWTRLVWNTTQNSYKFI